MKTTRLFLLIVLFLLNAFAVYSQTYSPDWASLDKRPVPQWFPDAKFGIFIHWGVYSVPAWAPASADIGIYAKYAEWYWWRINENSVAGKLFRDYHNRMYGSDFLYPDFAGQFKAEHFDPVQWADVFRKAGARYVVLTSKHHEGFTLWPSAESWNWNSVDIGPHQACPDHTGDWYFTGNYPTPGGNRLVNKAFINYYEGKELI